MTFARNCASLVASGRCKPSALTASWTKKAGGGVEAEGEGESEGAKRETGWR